MAALGVFILWFGWFGFNGGSALAMDESVPKIIVNTFLCAVFGGLSALAWQMFTKNLISAESVMNGVLAGLVAITAGCHIVGPVGAIVIGATAAIVMQISSYVLEERFHIDDVVGAISVHGFAGAWGTVILVFVVPLSFLTAGQSRWDLFLVQLTGVAVCFAWSFGVSWILLTAINYVKKLRVSPADERIGLNVAEHGATTELHDLFDTMEDHIHGDLSARVVVDDSTDAGLITAQYNRVVDAIEAKNDEVEQTNARMKDVHDQAVNSRQALESSVAELTEFNHLAVGRELRMAELKREINELHSRLGESARYTVDDEDEQYDELSEHLTLSND
jgi:Amt family ammonium transporter